MDTVDLPPHDPGGRDTAPVGPAAAPADGSSLEIGSVIAGKYLIESVLGKGGMGVVLGAMHLGLRERVALKVLRAEAAQSAEAVARFLREAQALARLKSEHVARVMDSGTLASHAPYLVMEYLTGTDLAQTLRARGPLPAAEAVRYVVQACEAMVEAHAQGLVHRDLKPANLFLTTSASGAPSIKVIDFGIAKATNSLPPGDEKLTASTALLGSPAYMSPEQVRAASSVDGRSDVWSLGVILHELCAGRAPFEGETTAALVAAIAADAPASLRAHCPDLPAGLEAIVLGCLEKDRERRIPSARALAAALAPFAIDPEIKVSLVTTTGATEQPSVRRRSDYLTGGVMAMLALALLGALGRSRATVTTPPHDLPAPARSEASLVITPEPPAPEPVAESAAPPPAQTAAPELKGSFAPRPRPREVASTAHAVAELPAPTASAAIPAAPASADKPVARAEATPSAIPPSGDIEAAMARRKATPPEPGPSAPGHRGDDETATARRK